MKKIKLLIILLAPLFVFSQEVISDENLIKSKAGEFELGLRSTTSLFSSSGSLGYGIGGQFRIRMSNRVNTEWFADFITEDIEGLATRNDYHIGWSVMFYPINPINKKITPYIIAGHCFDYTQIYEITTFSRTNQTSRLSAATQAGLGTQIYLTNNLNLSFSGQYMLHLGEDVHFDKYNENETLDLHVDNTRNDGTFSLEGHVLFTISLNYKIANLW